MSAAALLRQRKLGKKGKAAKAGKVIRTKDQLQGATVARLKQIAVSMKLKPASTKASLVKQILKAQ